MVGGLRLFTLQPGGDDEDVWFDIDDSEDIINLIRFADGTNRVIDITVTSDFGSVSGRFDPDGFTTNYFRLPCAS